MVPAAASFSAADLETRKLHNHFSCLCGVGGSPLRGRCRGLRQMQHPQKSHNSWHIVSLLHASRLAGLEGEGAKRKQDVQDPTGPEHASSVFPRAPDRTLSARLGCSAAGTCYPAPDAGGHTARHATRLPARTQHGRQHDALHGRRRPQRTARSTAPHRHSTAQTTPHGTAHGNHTGTTRRRRGGAEE